MGGCEHSADTSDTIPTPPFVFGAKCQIRLKAVSSIMRYYESVGREATAANMKWTTCIKSFTQQALEGSRGLPLFFCAHFLQDIF